VGSSDGYLLTHEWPLYVFDGVPMFLTMCWFFFRYPSKIQMHPHHADHTELRSADEESVTQLRSERRKPNKY